MLSKFMPQGVSTLIVTIAHKLRVESVTPSKYPKAMSPNVTITRTPEEFHLTFEMSWLLRSATNNTWLSILMIVFTSIIFSVSMCKIVHCLPSLLLVLAMR